MGTKLGRRTAFESCVGQGHFRVPGRSIVCLIVRLNKLSKAVVKWDEDVGDMNTAFHYSV